MMEILLVEDNSGDVQLVRQCLKQSHIPTHVSYVMDGEEALAFLYRQDPFAESPRPDLILLDLNLPRKSGREVLATVKSDPQLRRIPIVVLTSSDAPPDVIASYDLHANCFVLKPTLFGDFCRVVEAIGEFWSTTARLPRKRTVSDT